MSQTYVVDRPLQGFVGEQLTVPASSGTKTVFNRRLGFNRITVIPAANMRLGLPPRIGGVWIRSAAGVWRDVLAAKKSIPAGRTLVDRGFTGHVLGLLSTDRLYVGWSRKVNDVFIDIGSTANAVASTLTCENSDNATEDGFAALTITDGTSSGGATFAIDGNITFTVPAGIAWAPRYLSDLFPKEGAPPDPLYWLRFASSASLTAGTLIDQIAGFIETDGAGTNTGDTAFLDAGSAYEIVLGDEVGAIQPIAQAAAATTAKVTWERF